MICARCLRRASQSFISQSPNGPSRISKSISRSISSSHPLSGKTPISPNVAQTATSVSNPPPTTSTSAAQPFSSRETLSPEAAGTSTSPPRSGKQRPKSSVPAGTPLKGINYFKNKEDPLAMEDHEYPDWLWELLTEKKQTMSGQEGRDPRLFAKSARARRAANKRERKAALENAGKMQQQVPIYEQSIDLPLEESARQELSKAMREKRRKDIKEANFLNEMN